MNELDGSGSLTSGRRSSMKEPGSSDHKVKVSHSETRDGKSFLMNVNGSVEYADIFGASDVYCKYNVAMGGDWTLVDGIEEGISQVAAKDAYGRFVWNFPLEVAFKSTNPYGWPQLVVSVYGADFMGNHVTRGYGVTVFPVSSGVFTKTIPLFVPESSSFVQKLSSWLMGRHPEFVDPKILAQDHGRQVVRTVSHGHVVVRFNVVMKDFRQLGYVSSGNVYN